MSQSGAPCVSDCRCATRVPLSVRLAMREWWRSMFAERPVSVPRELDEVRELRDGFVHLDDESLKRAARRARACRRSWRSPPSSPRACSGCRCSTCSSKARSRSPTDGLSRCRPARARRSRPCRPSPGTRAREQACTCSPRTTTWPAAMPSGCAASTTGSASRWRRCSST